MLRCRGCLAVQKYGSDAELDVLWKKRKLKSSAPPTRNMSTGAACTLFPLPVVVFPMHIILLCIGATAKGFLDEGIKEYSKRLERYTAFSMQVLPPIRNAQSLTEAELKQREGARFLEAIQPGDAVVVLDERGTERTSRGLSKYLQTEMNAGRKRVVFIVGGVYGLSNDVHARASSSLRLSAMTLTHDMVRLLFVEQLYRAFTILAGEKYHHD